MRGTGEGGAGVGHGLPGDVFYGAVCLSFSFVLFLSRVLPVLLSAAGSSRAVTGPIPIHLRHVVIMLLLR